MIYNKDKDSFDIFMSRWSIDDEYVLYGASKDACQLIETFDNILSKKNSFKVNCIIDDYLQNNTSINNIYELNESTYKPDNFNIPNQRKNLKIINFETFIKDAVLNKLKIIITTDYNYNKIKSLLLSYNLKENIDFCVYKKVAAIWPFKLENKTHLWRSDILFTEKCTLNCTFCNMYMPHYKNPKHRKLEEIINDFDLYFNVVDYVSIFHMVGGEPLMNPDNPKAIDYIGRKYRKKIGRLLLTTNGTLVPKPSTFELFKKYCVTVSISDYTDSIKYERKLNKFVDLIHEYDLTYFIRSNIEWIDFGDPNEIRFFGEKENIDHFDSCTAPYKGINNGKYFYCHLNTSAILSGMHNLSENDYYLLNNNTDREELLKFDLGYLKKGYATFCQKCNGCNTGKGIPVSPSNQGLRA